MGKIEKFIDEHEKALSLALRIIEVFIIGLLGLHISSQVSKTAQFQLELSQSESQPAFCISLSQEKNDEGYYDTNILTISNENGYMSNYHSKHIDLIHIKTNLVSTSPQDVYIPATGLWNIGEFSGSNKGTIERRWDYKNNEHFFALINATRNMIDAEYGDEIFFDIDSETYLQISYLDILKDEHTVFFRVEPIYGTIAISSAEYDQYCGIFDSMDQYRIDLANTSAAELIECTKSVLEQR